MLEYEGHSLKLKHKYNPLQYVLIGLRGIPIIIIMCYVIVFQEYIRPYIMIPIIRRYLSCLVNLICLRIVLLLLGLFRFDCDGFRYFRKEDLSRGRMLTFRSGWVGVCNHKNILDFFYYSYLFNPTYVRPIYLKYDGKVLYTPLTFKQAFKAALTHRGFEPIYLQDEYEYKRLKCRKMKMQTVVSECFEELNGPIMIMLPGFLPNQHIKMEQMIGMDIHENQRKFLRSGCAFMAHIQPITKQQGKIKHIGKLGSTLYPNQLQMLLDCVSSLSTIKLSISVKQIIKYKFQYNKQTYSSFIDEFYVEGGYALREISYEEYKEEMDKLDALIRQSK